MRLIDADNFRSDLINLRDCSSINDITATVAIKMLLNRLDNADTVDAMDIATIGYEAATERYKKAFDITCRLLNKENIYGIDDEVLFSKLMQKYSVVTMYEYQKFIQENLDRFSDDDNVRHNAIERLGW